MRCAYVTTNLLDMWSRPQFNCERVSQLFFADMVEVSSIRKGYARVKQPDGYSGWVLADHLQPISKRQMSDYTRGVNSVVSADKAVLHRNAEREDLQPHFVYYGTRLRVARPARGLVRCRLPDNSTVYLKAQRIRPINSRKGKEATPSGIVSEAKRFLGVPYLWGGVSPAGFDCSGFVRAVYGSFGIYLPRDTKDQIRCGIEVAREHVRTGDLLFFDRHVGLAMSGERLIHASVGGSGVRINALTTEGDNYRPDLNRKFATARRILC